MYGTLLCEGEPIACDWNFNRTKTICVELQPDLNKSYFGALHYFRSRGLEHRIEIQTNVNNAIVIEIRKTFNGCYSLASFIKTKT